MNLVLERLQNLKEEIVIQVDGDLEKPINAYTMLRFIDIVKNIYLQTKVTNI